MRSECTIPPLTTVPRNFRIDRNSREQSRSMVPSHDFARLRVERYERKSLGKRLNRISSIDEKNDERKRRKRRSYAHASFFFSNECPVQSYLYRWFSLSHIHTHIFSLSLSLSLPFLRSFHRTDDNTTSRLRIFKKALTLKDPKNQMYKISAAAHESKRIRGYTPTVHRSSSLLSY